MRIVLDEVGISTFQWMPYALGLVCFDGVPARLGGVRYDVAEGEVSRAG